MAPRPEIHRRRGKFTASASDPVGYTEIFGAFLSSGAPELAKATVPELVTTHVLTLNEAVGAQAKGDQSKTYRRFEATMVQR